MKTNPTAKTIAIDARILRTSTGRYVERLLEYLQQIDAVNQYIILLLKKDFDGWQPSATNFTKAVADFPIYSTQEQLGFYKLLSRLKPDLVHFTMPQYPIRYKGAFITTIHDLTLMDYVNSRDEFLIKKVVRSQVKPAAFKLILGRAIRNSRHIITPTEYVRQDMLRRFTVSPEKITVTYEAADKLPGRPEQYPQLANKKFIMALGNAYPYKNLQRLIDAYAKAKLADSYQLVLVGKTDYYYQQLKNYVAQNKITGVAFTGFLPDVQVAWLYQHTALLVFPSLSEGFGLPGLEAMQYGTPVVASNATTLPEVYGDAAVYFDPKDTDEMAHVISKTLVDPATLKRLKAAGPARAAQYSWKRLAQQTLDIYLKTLGA